ncbi:MAG: PIG-P-domain-containing protein [Benjaminiella poitrasii]|nr:MAG: PIG-P-domain-containing protein [Benjaminiella poitrasii]
MSEASSIKKRSLRENVPSLSTSRSTPSLPNLFNYAILSAASSLSKMQMNNTRLSYSEQSVQSIFESSEKDKNSIISKRRHSFSSFLNTKYRKGSIGNEEIGTNKDDSPKTMSDDNNHSYSVKVNDLKTRTNLKKKGHRPRSYSEMSFQLPRAERAPPVAITNKTPAYEYYGFVMYLSSFVAFVIYLIWSYVPDEILHRLGITYYPNRYWALAIPVWLMTFVWFIFFSFMAINLMNTAPFDSISCITDEHANLMSLDNELDVNQPSDWIPELQDIPISLVNKFLYQEENSDTEPYMMDHNTIANIPDKSVKEGDSMSLRRKSRKKSVIFKK